MFNRYLIVAKFLWLKVLLGSVWIFFNPSPEAQETYRQLMTASDQHKKERALPPHQETKQKRTNVSKQIIFSQGRHRSQSRLTSQQSELIFSDRGNGFELVEHFQGICCLQQEKLFFAHEEENADGLASPLVEQPQQFVRQLTAKEAIYSYKSGYLEAQEVEFTRYLCMGLGWPASTDFQFPLMRGKASQIAFTLSHEPVFKAHGLHAILHDWGDDL